MGSSQPRQNRESLALIAYFLRDWQRTVRFARKQDSSGRSPGNCAHTQLFSLHVCAVLAHGSTPTFAGWSVLVSLSYSYLETITRHPCQVVIDHRLLLRMQPAVSPVSATVCLHPTRLQGSARRLGQPTRSTLASASGGRRRLVCRSPLVLTPLRPCHRRLSVVLAACGHRNPPRGRAPTSHHPTQPHAKAPASAPRGRGAVRGRAEAVVAPAVAPPTVTVTAQMVVAQLAVGNATSARRLLQASR